MRVIFTAALWLITMILAKGAVSQSHELEWAFLVNAANSSTTFVHKIANDADGDNIFVIGSLTDTAVFGSGQNAVQLVTTNKGRNEIFIAKYTRDKELVWVRKFNQLQNIATNLGVVLDIVVDAAGDVYGAGYFSGSVDFNPGEDTLIYRTPTASLGTAMNVFVVKLNGEGEFKWANRISTNVASVLTYTTTALLHGHTLSISNHSGNILLGGYSQTYVPGFGGKDTLNFGDEFKIGETGVYFGALNKETGKFEWAKAIHDYKGTGKSECHAISNDKLGNIYITGAFLDSMDFDPSDKEVKLYANPARYSINSRNMFLAKYDTVGELIWVKKLDAKYYGSGSAIALDDSANVHVAGIFLDSMDFNPDINNTHFLVGSTAMPNYNSFVSKFDSSGNFIWAGQYAGTGATSVRDITLDAFGNIYTIGSFRGLVDFDPGSGIDIRGFANATHVFISKLTAQGAYSWVRTFGPWVSLGHSSGYGLTIDNSNNLYAVGSLNRQGASTDIDFNQDFNPAYSLTVTAQQHGFLLKLSCGDTSLTLFNEEACGSFTLNDITYDQSGTYIQKYWSSGGCDSIIKLELNINNIEKPTIVVQDKILAVSNSYASYQWFKDSVALEGATNETLNVEEFGNGTYYVVVKSDKSCADTSDGYKVNNATSIPSLEGLKSQTTVSPNPTTDKIHVNAPVPVNLILAGIDGKIWITEQNTSSLSLSEISAGVYFLSIFDSNNQLIKVEKIVKQ